VSIRGTPAKCVVQSQHGRWFPLVSGYARNQHPYNALFVKHLPDVGACRISTNPVSYESTVTGFYLQAKRTGTYILERARVSRNSPCTALT
jgi:hypothetical protein